MGRGTSRKRGGGGGSGSSGSGRGGASRPPAAPEVDDRPAAGAATSESAGLTADFRRLHLWQLQSVRDLLLVAVVLFLIWVGHALRAVTVPLLVGLLLAYLFEPLVARMAAGRRFNRNGAVMTILAVGVSGVILVGGLLTPLVVSQTAQLAAYVKSPRIGETVSAFMADVPATPGEMLDRVRDAFGFGEETPDPAVDGDGDGEGDVEGAGAGTAEPGAAADGTVAAAPGDAASAASNPAALTSPAAGAAAGAAPVVDAVEAILASRGQPALTGDEREQLRGLADPTPPNESVVAIREALRQLLDERNGQDPLASAAAYDSGGSFDYLGLVRGSARTIGGFLGAIVSFGLVAFLVPFYFYCFSAGWPRIVEFFATLVPDRHEDRVNELVARMDTVVAGFVRGRIVISIIMGVMFAIGWWICGVPYAIPVGLVVGIFSAVPYLGGVGIPLAVGLLLFEQLGQPGGRDMPWWAIFGGPLLVFAIVQLVEGYVLTPLIAGKATNLDPVTILVAVLAGGSVLGVYGMLIAIPVAACAKIVIIEIVLPRIDSWTRGERSDPLPLDH